MKSLHQEVLKLENKVLKDMEFFRLNKGLVNLADKFPKLKITGAGMLVCEDETFLVLPNYLISNWRQYTPLQGVSNSEIGVIKLFNFTLYPDSLVGAQEIINIVIGW